VVIFDEDGRERASTTTDASGAFKVTLRPRHSTSLQARWLAAISDPVPVKVRPKVKVSVSKVRLFGRASVSGTVQPAQDSRRVSVRLITPQGTGWSRKLVLKDGTRFSTTFRVRKPGRHEIRASFSDSAGARGVAEPVAKAPPLPSLGPGSNNIYVKLLEKRLRELAYHLNGADRTYNERTADALRAFNKVQGRARVGTVDASTWRALASPVRAAARHKTDGFHFEIDQTRQVLLGVRDGKVVSIIHVSTGRPGYTPDGSWRVYRKIEGYSPSRLYYPSYYEGRRALHGWPEVPTYNASSGCTRLPMWTAKWVHKRAAMGTVIHIYH
jgi:lipoprotein-anchoring transpeptidase ErfK/SrfK